MKKLKSKKFWVAVIAEFLIFSTLFGIITFFIADYKSIGEIIFQVIFTGIFYTLVMNLYARPGLKKLFDKERK